jgi:precorrin-8X/cobalt-precorrin-8 methylmutase
LEAETQTAQSLSEELWQYLDAATADHPEDFREALQHLLPDLSQRSEIEVDVLSHLVLACGDVSLAAFVRFSPDAVKAARESLQAGCTVDSCPQNVAGSATAQFRDNAAPCEA